MIDEIKDPEMPEFPTTSQPAAVEPAVAPKRARRGRPRKKVVEAQVEEPASPPAPAPAPEPVPAPAEPPKENKPATIMVTPVHPYKLFCITQQRWLYPGERTELIRDGWVESQLKFKGIKAV
jgi:hypothetical protein